MGTIKQVNQSTSRLVFTQGDFSGGINSMDLDQTISDSCVKLAKNFDLSLENNLDKRRGYYNVYNKEYKAEFEKANSTLGKIVGNIKGFVQSYSSYLDSSGKTVEFWAIDGKLYKYPFIFEVTAGDGTTTQKTYTWMTETFQSKLKFDIVSTDTKLIFLTGTEFYWHTFNETTVVAIPPYIPTYGEFINIKYGGNALGSLKDMRGVAIGTIAGIIPTYATIGDTKIFSIVSNPETQSGYTPKTIWTKRLLTGASSSPKNNNWHSNVTETLTCSFDTEVPVQICVAEYEDVEGIKKGYNNVESPKIRTFPIGKEVPDLSTFLLENAKEGLLYLQLIVQYVYRNSTKTNYIENNIQAKISISYSDAPNYFIDVLTITDNQIVDYNESDAENTTIGESVCANQSWFLVNQINGLWSPSIVNIKFTLNKLDNLIFYTDSSNKTIAASYPPKVLRLIAYNVGSEVDGTQLYRNVYETVITPKTKPIKTSPNLSYLKECRFGYYKNGYLMVYGGNPDNSANSKNTIFISAIDQPDYFPEYSTVDIQNATNGQIQKVMPWNSEIQNIIFLDNAIYKFTFTDITNANVELLTTDVGCTARESIANVNNKLYFVSGNYVYSLENVTWSPSGLTNTKLTSLKITDLMIGENGSIAETAIGFGLRNEYHLIVQGIQEYNDSELLETHNRIFKLYTNLTSGNNYCWYMDEGKYLDFCTINNDKGDITFVSSNTANILKQDQDIYIDGDVDQFWDSIDENGNYVEPDNKNFEIYTPQVITKSYNTSAYPLHQKTFRKIFLDVGVQTLEANLIVGSQVDGSNVLSPTTYITVNENGGIAVQEVTTANHTANPGTFPGLNKNKGSFIWKTSKWGWKKESLKFQSSSRKGLSIAIIIQQQPNETSTFKVVNVGMEYRVRKIKNS